MFIRHILLLTMLLAACGPSTNAKPASAPASPDSASAADLHDRLEDATALVGQFHDKLPPSVAKNARCVVVVPAMLKGGLIVGVRSGKGFAACRTPDGWSAPAPVAISGGGAGLQAGVETVDLMMVVMNERSMTKLLSPRFTLGADVSAAAGPVGRGREADTDSAFRAEVLSYARSHGLFAGAELNGAAIRSDGEAIQTLYGAPQDAGALLAGKVQVPAAAQGFIDAVRKTFS